MLPLLAELARAHLIAEPAPGRFALHDLLRVYAAEQALAVDTEEDRWAARLLDHYVHSAHAAALPFYPERRPLPLPPPGRGVTAEPLAGHAEATAWFVTEHAALLDPVRLAAWLGSDAHVWRLAWGVVDFPGMRGHWRDQLEVQEQGPAAALRCGEEALEVLDEFGAGADDPIRTAVLASLGRSGHGADGAV